MRCIQMKCQVRVASWMIDGEEERERCVDEGIPKVGRKVEVGK